MSLHVNAHDDKENFRAFLKRSRNIYKYEMYIEDGSTVVFAETLEELVTVLIKGYQQLTIQEKYLARIMSAMKYAEQLQAMVVDDYIVNHPPEKNEQTLPTGIHESDWKVLISPRKGEQPKVCYWSCPVPLVVVATGYSPHTEKQIPISTIDDKYSNVWVIDPTNDDAFITSLHKYGIVSTYMLGN